MNYQNAFLLRNVIIFGKFFKRVVLLAVIYFTQQPEYRFMILSNVKQKQPKPGEKEIRTSSVVPVLYAKTYSIRRDMMHNFAQTSADKKHTVTENHYRQRSRLCYL